MLARTLFNRTDWVIAVGRVLLAVFGMLAIWIDPSQPAKFQIFTYNLLGAYVVLSLLILGLTLFRSLTSNGMAVFTHLVDLAVFSVLMCLTEGVTSPFFVLFTFALLAAALRWGWKGVLWTAVASLTVLSMLGWWLGYLLQDPEFELNRFMMRAVYLAVVSLLLAYMAAHQERAREMTARLSMQAPSLQTDADWPIDEALVFAAQTLNVRRILFAWAEREEPWQHISIFLDGEIEHRSESPERFEPLVATELAQASFYSLGATDDNSVVVHGGGGRFGRWRGLPLNPDLLREFSISHVLSVPVPIQNLDARLFLLDPVAYSVSDLPLVELAATRISTLFDQYGLLQRLNAAAADNERLRLAREIHDGVLQFLAGTGLNLQSAATLISADPDSARRRIEELQRALVIEQTQLRSLVNSLRTGELVTSSFVSGLKQSLQPLLAHLSDQWGIPINCQIEPEDAALDQRRVQDIARIFAEATANARRHGNATVVDLWVGVCPDRIDLVIADNGRGFPVPGRYEHERLGELGIGPRSLSERVVTLGGRTSLETAESGTRIQIRLPLRTTSAHRAVSSAPR